MAQLVEKGLARELLEELQAAVLKTQHQQPPGLKIDVAGGAAHLWAVEQSYVWPRTDDLSPGYFSGYSSFINFPPSDFRRAQDKAKRLLARLGRMSQREIENLSELWLLQCDAMIASRKWEPLDSKLTQMRMPLFSALLALERRGAASGDVRRKLEKMVAADKGSRRSPGGYCECARAG